MCGPILLAAFSRSFAKAMTSLKSTAIDNLHSVAQRRYLATVMRFTNEILATNQMRVRGTLLNRHEVTDLKRSLVDRDVNLRRSDNEELARGIRLPSTRPGFLHTADAGVNGDR